MIRSLVDRVSLACLVSGLALLATLLFSASAQAVTYTTGTALSTGQLAASVAVDQSSGDLYVASPGTTTGGPTSIDGAGTIKRFSSAGAPLSCTLTPAPEHPVAVAVNPANGRIHVVNIFTAAASGELRDYPTGCGSELAVATGTATTTSGSTTLTNVVTATGTGTLTNGSVNVTGLTTSTGSFIVGQTVTGAGVPAGATVAAVGSGTLQLSAPAEASGAQSLSAGPQPLAVGQAISGPGIPSATGSGELTSGSKNVTGVSTASGEFVVGQKITGVGVAAGATITAVGTGTLELSNNALKTTVSALTARTTVAALGIQSLTLSVPATATGSAVAISGLASRLETSSSFAVPQPVTDTAGHIFAFPKNGINGTLLKLEPNRVEIPFASSISPVSTSAIATDAAGYIYVANGASACSAAGLANGKLQKYKPNGELIGTFAGLTTDVTTVTVNRKTGDVLVGRGCRAIASHLFHVEQYSPGGVKLAEFGSGLFATNAIASGVPNHLAVNETTGTVYAADSGNASVQVFNDTSAKRTFSATTSGSGTGTVTCNGTTCQPQYDEGAEVTVEANPAVGSKLKEWTAGTGSATSCTSTTASSCTFTISANSSVNAEFAPVPKHSLNASVIGNGSIGANEGTVSGCTSAGGASCTGEYYEGTVLTLTATADPNNHLVAWNVTGAGSTTCTGTASPCTVTIGTGTITAAAEFAQNGFNLKLLKVGTGLGTVASVPSGVNCGPACPEETVLFPVGEVVTLEATPQAGSEFKGWGALECESEPEFGKKCVLTMSSAKEVHATFALQPTLTINKTGTGSGSVECEFNNGGTFGACTSPQPNGTLVKVKATANAGSELTSFSGTGSANGCAASPCTFTIEADSSVSAGFGLEPGQKALTVNVSGEGSVQCKVGAGSFGACNPTYTEGSQLTLHAVPGSHATFVGWSAGTGSAAGCSGTSDCVFTLNADSSVDASFPPIQRSLTTAKAGTGNGSFECKTTGSFGACNPTYTDGETIVVKATPDSHSTFAGWAGCSSSSANECTVTAIAANTTVTATFNLAQRSLTVAVSGSGTVSANVGPVDECSAAEGTCSGSYSETTEVTLTAAPASGHEFVGWSGSDAGACDPGGINPSCTLTIPSHDAALTATFVPADRALTIALAGRGAGTVTCNGAPCSSTYPTGTVLTLSATPNPDSTFAGFSGGGCSGTASTCQTTIKAATTVTATFLLSPAPHPARCLVPRLKGKTLAQAKRALAAAGCTLGKVTRPRRHRGALLVRSSAPPPGASMPPSSAVNLRLAAKPMRVHRHRHPRHRSAS